jgi:spore coat polysaccharide biosynthesis protein SpsF (cytidylyltransferase family)
MTGEESDLLGRHLAVAIETNCDLLVRITGDCPFLPPDEIDRLVQSHGNNEYTTNYTDRMPVGTDVDILTTDVLRRLRGLGEDHPVIELRSNPEEWGVNISKNHELAKYSDVDVAVDTPADYWRLLDATETVGAEPVTIIEWLADEN